MSEFELACLLYVLGQSAIPGVDELLAAVAFAEVRQAAWLGPVARSVLNDRPDTKHLGPRTRGRPSMKVGRTRNPATADMLAA